MEEDKQLQSAKRIQEFIRQGVRQREISKELRGLLPIIELIIKADQSELTLNQCLVKVMVVLNEHKIHIDMQIFLHQDAVVICGVTMEDEAVWQYIQQKF